MSNQIQEALENIVETLSEDGDSPRMLAIAIKALNLLKSGKLVVVDRKRLETAVSRLLSRNSYPDDAKSGEIITVDRWSAYLTGVDGKDEHEN